MANTTMLLRHLSAILALPFTVTVVVPALLLRGDGGEAPIAGQVGGGALMAVGLSPRPRHVRSEPTPSMTGRRSESPMRIRLSGERRAALVRSIKSFFDEELDEPISDLRAEELLDFFVRELGPPVYNQGVRDAASFVQERLTYIEGEVYERERS